MRFLVLLSLILRNLLRQRRRAAIAIGSVAAGIAALVVADGYLAWMFLDFREATIASQYAHLQITRPSYHEEGRADPARFLLPSDEAAAAIAQAPHVKSWGPRLAVTGLISRGESTLAFIGEGYAPGRDLTDDRALRILAGRRLVSGDSDHVLLGVGLARQLGAQPGDVLVLLVDNPKSGLAAIEATVAGVFESVSRAYDDAAVLMPITTARRLLKTQGAHAWFVYLDDTRHVEEAARFLRQAFPASVFEVRRWSDLAEFYRRAVDLFAQQLLVLRVIVVAIILLGIANTMMMTVMERTGEIGTLMALGLRRGRILRQFLAEGALIGIIGGGCGILLAVAVSVGFDLAQIEMPPPPSLTRGYLARVLIAPSSVMSALTLAVASTILAAAYPAWKASRMVIVDAIRQFR